MKRRLDDRRVILLAGARQCGKTTLARALRSEETKYCTLDDQTLRAAAVDDPHSFVRQSARTLIIDEIQRAPELLPAIKLVVDEGRRPYVSTCSHTPLFGDNIVLGLNYAGDIHAEIPHSSTFIRGST